MHRGGRGCYRLPYTYLRDLMVGSSDLDARRQETRVGLWVVLLCLGALETSVETSTWLIQTKR